MGFFKEYLQPPRSTTVQITSRKFCSWNQTWESLSSYTRCMEQIAEGSHWVHNWGEHFCHNTWGTLVLDSWGVLTKIHTFSLVYHITHIPLLLHKIIGGEEIIAGYIPNIEEIIGFGWTIFCDQEFRLLQGLATKNIPHKSNYYYRSGGFGTPNIPTIAFNYTKEFFWCSSPFDF